MTDQQFGRTLEERFWSKVRKGEGCWEWTASKHRDGYGQFRVGRSNRRAHRVSYELSNGPIPEGLVLDHLCRNPGCVNPSHLEPVTYRENIVRGVGPAMTADRWAAMTHCVNGHERVGDNLAPRADGTGWQCRPCMRATAKAYRVRLASRSSIAAVAAAGLVVLTTQSADAHTPGSTVDCATGVTLTGTNYDARVTNTWSITVNGVTQGGTFGSSLSKTVPVPQGGATSTWAVTIDAPGTAYDYAKSGTVGPCGTPPPPPPPPPPVNPPPVTPEPRHAVTHVRVVDRCNCYRDSVTMTGGDHVRIKVEHPAKTLWVFTVTGKVVDGVQYLLPSRIGGHSGWAVTQVYKVRTTNKPCPCKERGDCAELYPGYTPPSQPCRGRECK